MTAANCPTMLTAREAIAEGSTPAVFFSIAKFNAAIALREHSDYHRDIARRAREVGREIARITGMDVGGRRWRAANDNRGRTRNRKAA